MKVPTAGAERSGADGGLETAVSEVHPLLHYAEKRTAMREGIRRPLVVIRDGQCDAVASQTCACAYLQLSGPLNGWALRTVEAGREDGQELEVLRLAEQRSARLAVRRIPGERAQRSRGPIAYDAVMLPPSVRTVDRCDPTVRESLLPLSSAGVNSNSSLSVWSSPQSAATRSHRSGDQSAENATSRRSLF